MYRSADLFPTDLHKGRQVGQADGLAAVLGGGYLGYNLGGDVAGSGEAVGLLNHGAADHGTVLQHILQVHQVAVVHVLGKVIAVMEVNNARLVSLHNILGQQNALGDVLRHLAGHIVPLHAVNGGVLVGFFLLDLLVVALNEGEDLVVCGVGLADQGAGVAVAHIAPGHFKGTLCHDLVLHNVLNFLYGQGPVGLYRLEFHILGDLLNLRCGQLLLLTGGIGLGDGDYDFVQVKIHFAAVSLDDLHTISPFLKLITKRLQISFASVVLL